MSTNESDTTNGLEIAVIGMAGRFPGAADVAAFWRNLCAGVESISFFDQPEHTALERLLLPEGARLVNAKGILAEIDCFDDELFGVSPREAALIDPQQRVFLECAWAALDDAGCDPQRYPGLIGVYAGAAISTYLLHNLLPRPDLLRAAGSFQLLIANDKDHLATQTAYRLNLRGPGVTVQSACSTSLVAVHLACQALLSGGCDMALAGGVSIRLPQQGSHVYQDGGVISPDGHVRAFDARAQGMIGGNGAGVVVLKRLADAQADGDTIYAVIKGSAINNDGAGKVGYTAPSVDGQARAVADALLMAGVEPDTIGYIEAHGTATPLGDPIEIAALTQAFRAATDRRQFCAIGSVKTNIGHLDTAAGIAGLIKAVLVLRHGLIPPSLHFEQPNPQIDFDATPFYVNTKLTPWQTDGTPRRAGVSSFGIGGTNAHLVLEEASLIMPTPATSPWHLLPISAVSEAALERATDRLAEKLRDMPEAALGDAAYTLQTGRRELPYRRMLVCCGAADAAEALAARDPRRLLGGANAEGRRPVAFLFPGQGTQYPGMTRDLYDHEPLFRAEVDRCAAILRPHLGLDIRDVLYPDPARMEDGGWRMEDRETSILHPPSSILNQTQYAQPALFVVEYALAQLWMAWGVQPRAMLGHSIGEYVAACLAGVMTLEDALALVAARGRLIQELPGGAMLSVALAPAALEPLLGHGLDLAAINGPELCVVSGRLEPIERLERLLVERGLSPRRLHMSHAFHSRMLDPIVAAFEARVRAIRLSPPSIPYLSNLTGAWIRDGEATDPSYWARHLRQAVRFADGARTLLEQGNWVFLEVGPGRALATLLGRQGGALPTAITSLRSPGESLHDQAALLTALGRLWLAGVPVSWADFVAGETHQRVPLPAYPFERRRHWVDPQEAPAQPHAPSLDRPAPRATTPNGWGYVPFWKPAALPRAADPSAKHWLLLVDEAPLGAALARRLEQAGHTVTMARAGERFAQLDQHEYALNPADRADYTALLEALRAAGQLPERIALVWGLAPAPLERAAFHQTQERGFAGLLRLAQALGMAKVADDLRLWRLTPAAPTLDGATGLPPAHAAALGASLVIAQEQAGVRCATVAMTPPPAGSPAERRLLDQLCAELAAEGDQPLVAYQGGQRWVRRFEPAQVEHTPGGPGLRSDGAYLITGGLQGIGRELAGFLADQGARLALIERPDFPPRDQWAERLAALPQNDPLGRAIRAAHDLEASGAQLIVIPADLTDLAQLRVAVDQAERQLGGLNGFIHAALLNSAPFAPIADLDPAGCVAALWSVAAGLTALEQALEGRALDFCLIQSSLSALLGGLGAAADAATQLLVAAFVEQHNRAAGMHWGLIAWDRWRLGEERAARSGEPTIGRAEGGELLRYASAGVYPQLVVSTSDLDARLVRLREQEQATARPGATSRHSRPNLPVAYAPACNPNEQIIVEIWQELLGIEPIGIHDNFFDLGGHSLMATQFMARLRDAFRIELPLRSIFESTSVSDLALLVARQQAAAVDQQRLAQLLAEIQRLSPEELNARLAAQRNLST